MIISSETQATTEYLLLLSLLRKNKFVRHHFLFSFKPDFMRNNTSMINYTKMHGDINKDMTTRARSEYIPNI